MQVGLISVVIPVKNKERFLSPCLDSVIAASRRYGKAEIIVVDNMSSDRTYDLLQARTSKGFRVLRCDAETVSAVRNRGAQAARGEILCFIDSDCLVPEQYFGEVVRALSGTRIGAVGHQVALVRSSWIARTWHDLHFIEEHGETRWLPGACLSIRSLVFREAGGFREELVSGEDVELADRLLRTGYLVWSSPRLTLIHLDNPTTLRAFLAKEIWRGLGTTARRAILHDRVLMVTIVHLIFLGAALVLVLTGLGSPALALSLGLPLTQAVPVAAVAIRLRQVATRPPAIAGWRDIIPGIVLYQVFFVARGVGAVQGWLANARRRHTPN